MPQLGETVDEGTIVSWHKKAGDDVVKDELLLDVETAKVAVEIPAPVSGKLTRILVEEGRTVDVGTVLAEIDAPGDAAKVQKEAPAQPAAKPEVQSDALTATAAAAPASRRNRGERLSPAVRRLIAEHDLDISEIAGTGEGGRVSRRDVMKYLESRQTGTAQASKGERLPFDRIRRVTAEHMVRSKAISPHVLQTIESDFSAVDAVRLKMRTAWKEQHGFSLTYLPFVARAVCLAIAEFPRINASVDGDGLVLHPAVNLAIAVDLNFAGLVAPVIRNAASLNVAELAHRFNDVAQRARRNALSADDLSGGTYTISNPGPFGTLFTAPIINQPQVAILSTDAVVKRPVVIEAADGDMIAIRPVGVLAQSFDHRAFDGAYSAAFLAKLKTILEQRDWSLEF
jgi:2-oxoglutarate dehydrogenase E2 component (dihydrolipoamide succinyltransferase)